MGCIRTSASLALLGLMLVGCGGNRDQPTPLTAGTLDDGSGTAASEAESGVATTGMSDTTDTTGMSDTTDTTGMGPKLDTLPTDEGTETGPPPGDGCQKVDFLFVIDNSESMRDEQENLATSFPGFIDTIQATVEAQDYHIMVVTTDAPNTVVCEQTMCGMFPFFPPPCPGYECGMVLEGCDATMGAGRVLDEGFQPCDIQGAQRFLLESQPNLDDTFACIAEVGIAGSGNERPMEAMLTALGDALAQPDACNETFLRDDAILVVTVITDEEDAGMGMNAKSPGDPPDWVQGLIASKGGNPDAVVVLAILGPATDAEQQQTNCLSAEVSPRLHEFVDLFGDKGFSASVCEADYGPFLLGAVETIDLTCDLFEPVG